MERNGLKDVVHTHTHTLNRKLGWWNLIRATSVNGLNMISNVHSRCMSLWIKSMREIGLRLGATCDMCRTRHWQNRKTGFSVLPLDKLRTAHIQLKNASCPESASQHLTSKKIRVQWNIRIAHKECDTLRPTHVYSMANATKTHS